MPDGLEGERVDAAIARLFGLSRAPRRPTSPPPGTSHQPPAAGEVRPGRRRRPARGAAAGVAGEPDPGGRRRAGARHDGRLRRRRHRRRRQAGRGRGPPERRAGPGRTCVGRAQGGRLPHLDQRGQRAPGHRLAARRRHLGPDGGLRQSERGYRVLKRAFKERRVDKTYHTLVQGLPDPLVGTIDAPIGAPPRPRLQVRRHGVRQAQPSRTTRCSRRSGTRRCSRSTSRPGAPTRSGCTSPRCATPASATSPTAPTPRWRPGSGLERQWLHAVGPRASSTPARGSGSPSRAPTRGPAPRARPPLTPRRCRERLRCATGSATRPATRASGVPGPT